MAATPFKVTARLAYVDSDNNVLPGVPITLRMSASDVAEAKVTFDDLDTEKAYTVQTGPAGAIGVRFQDIKGSADGVDTKALQLVIGTAPSTLIVRDDQLAEKAVDAHTRMQGLDELTFGIGTRLGFIQKA